MTLGLPGVFVHYMVQNVLAILCNQNEYTPIKTKWRICKWAEIGQRKNYTRQARLWSRMGIWDLKNSAMLLSRNSQSDSTFRKEATGNWKKASVRFWKKQHDIWGWSVVVDETSIKLASYPHIGEINYEWTDNGVIQNFVVTKDGLSYVKDIFW